MSRPSYLRAALTVLAIAVFAASAAAQAPAVIDPRVVEFDPSPDHSGTNGSGQPLLTRYDLELYLVDGAQPVRVINLGKPAPAGDGKIRVDFTPLLSPWPTPGTTYEARVAAIGPNGTGRSFESNTFAFSSACSAVLSPTSVSVGGPASTGSVAVSAVSGCAWTAASNTSWLTVTGGANSNGNGTVSYSVAANTTSAARSGSLTIAGLTFTVTQNAGCTYSTTPSATSVSSSATTGSVAVTTTSACAWTASSSASWISITSGAAGTGTGSVGYSVAANTGTSARTGTLTIAGRSFTLTQEGVACTFVLAPVDVTLGAAAGSATVSVTAASGCAWTAASNASWITVTSGANGSGNGQVAYSVTANPGTSSRTGTITIGGQTVTITQTGQTCTYSIAPVSASVPASATSGTVSVDTLAGCAWTASPVASWITITSGGSGSGDGTVTYSVAANPSLSPRSGTLTAGGQTFTVNQAGVVCSATIAPVSATVGSGGAQGTVAVTLPAACAWTATSGASWLTVTGGASGSGNGTVSYSAAANTSTSSRSANLTIAGQTFGVSQAGITCTYGVSPTSAAAAATAGTGSVGVTSASGCAWTASSAVSWMTITSGANGSGNGSVGYSFAANPTTQSRAGVLTVAGQAVTVTQAAGCGYSISPASASLTASAGSGTVTVTAGGTCAWTAQSSASWITFGTPTTTAGNGSVGYTVAANQNSSSRSATVTVAGQPFVITQAGAACDATLNPATQSIAAAGANGSVNITVPGGCAWTAVSSVSWLTVLTGASGSGNGAVTYRVDPNPAGTARTGTIAIGGRLLTVTQAGAACTATLSSTAEAFEASGGSRVVAVTIPSGCIWTAISNATWITVTSGGGANGAGSGAVTFLVAANTATAPRSGSLTVSGRTVTVDQAGTCDIEISPNSVSSGADAATGSVAVTTGASCSWSATASASWLSITSGSSGAGNGSVLYSTAANTTNAARTATLTIGGRVFSLTQAAPTCAAVLSTTSVSLTSGIAFRTVQITTAATCAWTASASVPWITITGGASGTGSGTVSYTVAANTGSASRTGTVTVAGQTVTVTQGGVPCTVNLTPTSISLTGAGTNAAVSVATSATCAWTASSNVSWLTVTSASSGTGPASVQYSVAPNTSSVTRLGTLTIGGRGFLVSQAGSNCNATLSSTAVSVGPAGSTVPVGVSAGAECNWTASSPASWIAVSGGGPGPGTVMLTVAENTGTSVRSATVSIAGRSFTVTQTGACNYTLSPTAVSVAGGNGMAFIGISAGAGCAWSAESSQSWVTLNSASGSGGALLVLTVAANTSTSPRTSSVTIADEVVTVTQAGAACHYSVSPTGLTVTGGTHTLTVAAPAGCAWSASSTAAWVTFTENTSGTGPGTVVVTLAPNTGLATRLGFLRIAGWRVMVTQRAGLPPNAPTGLVIR